MSTNLWGEKRVVETKIQNIVLSVTYDDTEFDLGKVARSLDGAVRGSSPLPVPNLHQLVASENH